MAAVLPNESGELNQNRMHRPAIRPMCYYPTWPELRESCGINLD